MLGRSMLTVFNHNRNNVQHLMTRLGGRSLSVRSLDNFLNTSPFTKANHYNSATIQVELDISAEKAKVMGITRALEVILRDTKHYAWYNSDMYKDNLSAEFKKRAEAFRTLADLYYDNKDPSASNNCLNHALADLQSVQSLENYKIEEISEKIEQVKVAIAANTFLYTYHNVITGKHQEIRQEMARDSALQDFKDSAFGHSTAFLERLAFLEAKGKITAEVLDDFEKATTVREAWNRRPGVKSGR